MKKFRKILALVLAFTMIMGLAMTASAKTIVSTNQDASVMTITSSTATVSYDATTVEGDGTTANPDVTRYSYYLMMPKGGSISSVPVSITLGGSYTILKADSKTLTRNGQYTGNLDFSNGTKTFVASNSTGDLKREFKVTAGVNGSDLKTVYVRVDIRNAVRWTSNNPNSEKLSTIKNKITAIKGAVPEKYKIGDNGIMTAFVPVELKAGATAMDALKAACTQLNLETQGSDTYVEAIGTKTVKLEQKDTDRWSGWMYLNKTSAAGDFEAANYGAASYNLAGGEYFAWIFVNTWGGDETGYVNTPKAN